MANSIWWTKMLHKEDFCAHFCEMTDAEIVADIRKSIASFLQQRDDGEDFGARMVKKAKDRLESKSSINSENGKLGGRPRKESTAGAPTREDGVDRKYGTPANHYGDADTREGSDESTTVSRNIGNSQATEARQSKAGSNSRHTPPEVSRESGNNFESAIDEALAKARTGGDSVRRVGVASPAVCHKSAGAPVRNSGRRFRNKEEYMQWAIDSSLDATDASECWDATLERGGKDADGNVVKNIKAFAVKWCNSREANRKKRSA